MRGINSVAVVAFTAALGLLFAANTARALEQSAIQELYNFYVNTSGPYWYANSGWNTPFDKWGDPCGLPTGFPVLHGVSCSGDGNLQNLQLANNNLTGTIGPNFFLMFPFLSTVDLSKNQGLTGTIPDFMPNSGLTFFFITLSRFTGTIPDSIFTPSLQQLHVDSNMLGGSIPDAIGNATALQYAYFGNNTGPISGAVPDTICNCGQLNVLDIMLSGITSLPTCFGLNMPRLTVMNFFKNALTGSIPDNWCAATQLIVFQIQENSGMSGTLPSCIGSWTQLSTLGIENTGVGGTIPDEVFQLTKLQSLTLSLSNFYGEIPDKFNVFENLQEVTLNGNPTAIQNNQPTYTGKFPRTLFTQSTIVTLTIGYTTIADTVPSVALMRNLQKLSLANNALISLTFPVELFRDVWAYPSSSPIPRELHLENTPLTGPLPIVTGAMPQGISQAGQSITLFNTNLQGFIPNSTLQWVPAPAQARLLSGCTQLLAPVAPWMLSLTSGFTGMQFQISSAQPSVFSMDGGATLTLTGSNLYAFPGTDYIQCGFCTAEDYSLCTSNQSTFVAFSVARFNSTTKLMTCVVPAVSVNYPIMVDLFYVGPAYSTATEFIKVSAAPAGISYYNPRPKTYDITPLTGRREGCTAITIRGEGFLNAPAPAVTFSTSLATSSDAALLGRPISAVGRGSFAASGSQDAMMPVLKALYPDIVATSVVVINDTFATAVLPFADAADFTAHYNQSYGQLMRVHFFPNGVDSGTGVSNTTYQFAQTCTTPLVKCQFGYKDPEGCPTQSMCRCHSTGQCDFTASTSSYTCSCGEGFTGHACDQCTENHYGPNCRPCPCVAGHGSCNWGITADGSCNCNKWYIGSTCSVSKLGVGIGIPSAVIVAAGIALYFRRMKSMRTKSRAESAELMNAT